MRGIGWAILYQDPVSGKLINQWINEHDVGHPAGCNPLLILDVFEHAFMIDYGLKRADYIAAFFKNIKWEAVEGTVEIIGPSMKSMEGDKKGGSNGSPFFNFYPFSAFEIASISQQPVAGSPSFLENRNESLSLPGKNGCRSCCPGQSRLQISLLDGKQKPHHPKYQNALRPS